MSANSANIKTKEHALPWVDFVPLWLGVGIAFFFALPFDPPHAWGWAWSIAVAMAYYVRRDVSAVRMIRVFALVLIGFALAQWQTIRVAAPVMPRDVGVVGFTGVVEDVSIDEGRLRLTLRDVLMPDMLPSSTLEKVRVSVRGEVTPPNYGDRVEGRGKLFAPSAPVSPNAFDFSRYFYFRGIGGIGFMFPNLTITHAANVHTGLVVAIEAWFSHQRQWINQEILRVYGGGERMMFATALITGDTTAVTDAYRHEMQITGLMHILSISGMHMAIMCGLFYVSMRRFLLFVPVIGHGVGVQKTAALLALLAGFLYVGLADFPIAAVRAYIMTSVVMLAVLCGRSALSIRSLSLAATAILCVDPAAFVEASFQLSFLATLALVVCYKQVMRLINNWMDVQYHKEVMREQGEERHAHRIAGWYILVGRIMWWFGLSLLTTLVASGATMPLVAYHFHQISLVTLFANMVTVPLLTFWVMPSLLVAVLGMPFGISNNIWWFAGVGIDVFHSILHVMAHFSWSYLHVPSMPSWSLALMGFGLLVAMMVSQRRVRLLALLGVVLGMCSVMLYHEPDVLVSPDRSLLAVRTPLGWKLLEGKSVRGFVVRQWQDMLGKPITMMDDAQKANFQILRDVIQDLPASGAYEGWLKPDRDGYEWLSSCAYTGARAWNHCRP